MFQCRLVYDNTYKLWMTTLTIGGNRIQAAVDTGSPFLVVNSANCASCPLEYGSHSFTSPSDATERIVYATQRVNVQFKRDAVAEFGNRVFTFASAMADRNSQMPPVNVLGLMQSNDPRSVCAQMGWASATVDLKRKLLVFGTPQLRGKYVNWPPGGPAATLALRNGSRRRVRIMIDTGTSFTRGTHEHPGVPYTLELGNGVYLTTSNSAGNRPLGGYDVIVGHDALRGAVVTFDYRNRLLWFS